MKQFFTLLMIVLFAHLSQAQNNDYSDLWKQVDQFENDGLPKSALEVVEQISKKAEADKNSPQQIKVLLFQSKYALTLEEDAQLIIINDFKSRISKSSFPTSHVLENILANLYWQYFQQNRWRFYHRTNTAEKVDENDFRTWDLQTLFDEIHLHFQNSLKNGLLLQQENLKQFEHILNKAEDSEIFRPSLFDLLAHNALEFYKTTENSITKPAYKFEIDDPSYFSNASSFSKLNIVSKDSTSLQLNALKIYQDLIQFHLKDKDPYALADVDIKRLLFVRRHATFSDKDTLIIQALKSESNRLASHEVSGLYDFEIASIYHQQGSTYQPNINEQHRWKNAEAVKICESVISKFADSKAALKCELLKQTIIKSNVQLSTEGFLPIDKNAKILIRYKNLDALNFKVYELSRNQLKQFEKTHRKNEQLEFIKKLKLVHDWESILRNEKDYQMHGTEILLPPLKNGYYLIFSSPEIKSETEFGFATVQITDFAVVEKSSATHLHYQLINRNNGQPIRNAKITIRFSRNDRVQQSEKAITDEIGEFKLKKSKDPYWSVNIEVEHQDELAFFDNFYVNPYYRNSENIGNDYDGFLFTDRSIYRPGQIVYFKGIYMKRSMGKSEVLSQKPVTASLHDVNGQKISELKLETNDFGSFHGNFVLPNGGLTGEYFIQTSMIGIQPERHYFSVEEYKRPKFEANFKPVTETFKLNDSVKVKGKALAYAGSLITDAKVVYRVHRQVQFPRWYYWYRPWFNSEPQEIAHGETMTDSNGDFEISFKALPDLSVQKSDLPIFHYEITADVTDINGETRSATTVVNVGYHTLKLALSVNSKLDKSKRDHKISIDSKNLNDEFVPAKGRIKVFKLKGPDRVLRPRPWLAPDYQTFSEEEFRRLFPNEAFQNEHDSNNWERGTLVLNSQFDTNTSKEVNLGTIKKWASGQYVIVIEAQDKFGQAVKDEAKTILYAPNDKKLADNQLFSITTNKEQYAAGENVLLQLGASGNLTVTVYIEKEQNVVDSHIITLDNNKKTISIPVEDGDTGGFFVHYSYSAYNSFEGNSIGISVPYPSTELEIETISFRDKLKPGQEESWSFKIKGPQGDKVTAELLAGMYDMSLDQFKPHLWNFNPIQRPSPNSYRRPNAGKSYNQQNFRMYARPFPRSGLIPQNYDQLNWFGFHFGYYGSEKIRGYASGLMVEEDAMRLETPLMMKTDNAELDEVVVEGNIPATSQDVNVGAGSPKKEESFDEVQIRKNLEETAFFFPQLQTDEEGNVTFSFTTPESLTKWKLQLLAHTKTLEYGYRSLEAVTQKELMVIPNAPRFLREGDQIVIQTKIANISDKVLSGQAALQLFDATNGQQIDTKLNNIDHSKPFSVDPQNNSNVSWSLSIPYDVQAVQYKIIAKAGDFSDGEQNALPVLSNRMLVTESMPMWIRSNQSNRFTLEKLKTNTSSTLKHHKLTLEMTSNPAWYAVQALPYLMEFPYDCNEQTFARFYANALATHIANSNPRIQEVFNQWKNSDALLSNLEKNQELKSLLIQETPWLRDAQSETEQKKRIALLFDLNKMNGELRTSLLKLQFNQMSNGAWPWFNGGRANRNITQHIVAGFMHLEHVSDLEIDPSMANTISEILEKALSYLDAEFVKEYKDIRKFNKDVDLSKDHLTSSQLQYLYIRSFIPDLKISKEIKDIIDYYQSQIEKYWLNRTLYQKAMMALIMHRSNKSKITAKILKSLKETSITSEEMGMYWKENTNSWYWYQAPIETQALLIEAFSEIENDTATIDNLKIWLLKNKQTNRWKSTKATTEAVYALLLQGSEWLSVTDMVDIILGNETIDPQKLEDVKVEAGTGYFKTSWTSSEINSQMANVSITKKGDGIAWGSMHWQYFEDLDKITSAETPLKLKKKLFLKSNTDLGESLTEITSESDLKIGDLLRVRIELRSDRAMEFVHMKDMRASGLEPVNVLSAYKWQDGLGYYESTKDASTNFFFDYLPKGVFVFEYDLRVNNSGNFSNGITTIQSMYAPEFSSHSEGIRVQVDQ